MIYDELIKTLRTEFQDVYVDDDAWPKAFRGSKRIKAIVLGTDPGNTYKGKVQRFELVFGLENPSSCYFMSIRENIRLLKHLDMEEVCVQNVCRGYFNCDTSNNKKWLAAGELWLPFLKNELDQQFTSDVPAMATSEIILRLVAPNHKRNQCRDYYENCRFISPEDNRLGRLLIPAFRHPEYQWQKWSECVRGIDHAFMEE